MKILTILELYQQIEDDDGTVDNGKAIVNARDTETPASWYADQSFDKRKIGTLQTPEQLRQQ